jgi:hypothetical protein
MFKMRKPLSFKQIAYGMLFCLLAAAAPSPCGEKAGAVAVRLGRIMAQIDSLEVEKQTAKRSGRSIVDLELITVRLRDTVFLLREELQVRKPDSGPEQQKGLAPFKKYLPSTFGLIDKIVIGAGAATLLFALIFFFFLLSAAARRRKVIAKKRPPVKAFEARSNASRGAETAARKAYDAQIKAIAEQKALLDKPQSPAPQPAAPSPKPRETTVLQTNLDVQVIKAFGDGQDVKTISQRFHIGVDQVALILKMAKKQ